MMASKIEGTAMWNYESLVRSTLIGISLQLIAQAATSASDDKGSDALKKSRPAQIVPMDGSKIKQLTLTEKAASRLDIQTRMMSEGSGKLTTPYASVVYDSDGGTWVYTLTKPLTYIRQKIVIETIKGDLAYLKSGPPTGTTVVTVGVAELYGTEKGLGH
jgi:hypothetical protein